MEPRIILIRSKRSVFYTNMIDTTREG
ncbi:uncharacterized protein METZ01_LOCUS428579, partial [marine metagenome]